MNWRVKGNNMQLLKLEIKREQWGADKGKFTGAISFDNKLGEINVNLSPWQCDKLFAVVAEGIIDTAKEAANELTVSVIEHKDELESK